MANWVDPCPTCPRMKSDQQSLATAINQDYGAGLSQRRIAVKYNLPKTTVARLMQRFSIPSRNLTEAAHARSTPEYCKAVSDRMTNPVDMYYVRALYEAGATMSQVARIVGLSQERLSQRMGAAGIPTRPFSSWKGDAAQYMALHERVYKAFGKPTKCTVCDTEDPNKTYDWANLTGKYEDVKDYARMCRTCHRRYDKARAIYVH